MQKRVLVIGGRGFIGGHICRALLASRYDVRIFTSSAGPLTNLTDLTADEQRHVELFQGQVASFADMARALRGCDHLIHAGIPYPTYSLGWQSQWPQARDGLRTVLSAAQAANISKSVFVSVSGTMGSGREGELIDERQPYSQSLTSHSLHMKYLEEQEILRAIDDGLQATLVNPTLCFGDWDTKPSSGRLLLALLDMPVRFGDDTPINALDARDAAAGTVAALTRGRIGGRYILGGENTTFGALARTVRNLAGVTSPKVHLPLGVAKLVCASSEVLGLLGRRATPSMPIIGVDILRHGVHHYDVGLARRELGFQSAPLAHTLQRTLHWFAAHGYLSQHARVAAHVQAQALAPMAKADVAA